MDAFRTYLLGLLGQFVHVGRAGPNTFQGWLLSVQSDYLTLKCPEGQELHLPFHHIRTVMRLPMTGPPPPLPPALSQPATFPQLLHLHCGEVVQFYQNGSGMCIGRLMACTDDYMLVELAPDEPSCFTLFHVRSFTATPFSVFAEFPPPSPPHEVGDPSGDVASGAGSISGDGGVGPMAPGGNP